MQHLLQVISTVCLQEDGEIKIEYEVVKETGPEHDKTYEVVVKANNKILGQGVGKSKKEAEHFCSASS